MSWLKCQKFGFLKPPNNRQHSHVIIQCLALTINYPRTLTVLREAYLRDFTSEWSCHELLCGWCVAVTEKEAHREWHRCHRVPRKKHSLRTGHDRLQLSPRLRCGPSGQPLLWQCSLQGNLLYFPHCGPTLLPVIHSCLNLASRSIPRCQWQHGMMYLSLARRSRTLLFFIK